MAHRKTVGIKELKNNLSAHLREVRRGVRLLVSDRGEIVAELHEPGAFYAADDDPNPVLAEWVRVGIVRLPKLPRAPMRRSTVRLPKGTASRVLDEDRRNRGR